MKPAMTGRSIGSGHASFWVDQAGECEPLQGLDQVNGFSFNLVTTDDMLICMTDMALHAVRRFGFGRRGSEALPDDVHGWLRSQLDAPDPLLGRPGPTMLNTALVARRFAEAQKAKEPLPGGFSGLFTEEMTASLKYAVSTDLPLRERLVWFWANHFTVSARGGPWSFGLNGTYVHEAIRPHVTGRFADMVKAVMRHPAMLDYLDNTHSIGPDSPIGLKQHRGINENLARESLELHTLGIQAGYTQRDVIAYAGMLSGRMMNTEGASPGFVYRADAHEPGPETVFGHTFPDGLEGSEDALEWIADHPATRRHIANQLVQHFVADVPPPKCVERLEAVLRDTGGDLKAAMLAIIDMPEAWQPLTKFRAPAEYITAVQRALDLPFEPGPGLLDATNDLGQPFRNPLLPNGWPDTAADWVAGEPLLKRADWAMTQALRPNAPSADAVASATLGELYSSTTRAAVTQCPNRTEALATLFASPEFLRR
jgi:uncharacterized protein (DUF1800 family)